MPAEDFSSNIFDLNSFNRAQDEIDRLRSRLPNKDVQALAREVIVRLAQRPTPTLAHHATPSDQDIDALCHALVSDDPDAAMRMIMQARSDGVSVADLYLYYLAVSARRLGAWWDNDLATFVDVTVGVSRIYSIMRGLHPYWIRTKGRAGKMAIFANVPGEDHTLGITMATDLFRQDGWSIDLEVGRSHDELVSNFESEDYSVIGLSASGRKSMSALIRLVLAIRISNPVAYVLVGGNIVAEEPDIVSLSGADGAVQDVPQALRIMNRLVAPTA
ncbi:MAG: cobalamin B12-binding domain-containing protein [Rhodobacter sp.]|nr:cobalamin B12-binding domain-containing protein [Rhodobacter sp.]